MKKKTKPENFLFKKGKSKTLLTMKLLLCFLMLSVLNVSGSIYSQNAIFNLSVEDKTVREVFRDIESQSHYRFLYNDDFAGLNNLVSLNSSDKNISEVLNELLSGANLTYRELENDLIVITPLLAEVQERFVTGRVTDVNTGESLIGVTIMISGTTIGTTSNVEGDYRLSVTGPDAVLVFTYVGYNQQEVVVGDQNIINIMLTPQFVDLDEVIVIGYGTAVKSDLTGSVTRVDRETFSTQSMTQVTEMLTGTVAGFRSSQGAGASGGGSLEVRGPTSLSAGTDPLIVLDGVIFNGSIRDINPADVESIDILKDASSAAIFGAKAASGVVLITTTKGAVGTPKFNFSSQLGLAEVSNDLREFGPGGFEKFRGEYLRALNVALPTYYYFDPNNLPGGLTVNEWLNYVPNPNPDPTIEWLGRLQLTDNEIDNYLAGNTISWYDEITQRGLRQKYDLSVNGGTDELLYYWSVGFTDNEGIILGDKYSVVRSRLNVSANIADFLTIGTNTQFAYRDEGNVNASLNYNSTPYGDKYDEDGVTLRWYTNGQQNTPNPLLNTFYQTRDRNSYNILSSLYAELDLPLGIKYKLVYQPRLGYSKDYNFWPVTTIVGGRDRVNGYGTRVDNQYFEWMVDNLLTWNGQFGIHKFDLTFLYNAEKFQSWRSYQSGENFSPNERLHFHSIQSASVISVENDDQYSTADAVMGRINYSLLDKYLITASIRQDGYSAFGAKNKRAVFPAVAFAWQISRENFWNEEWAFNRLKMRLSWGVNGNRDIGRYSALARLGQNLYYDGTGLQIGLFNNSLANSELAWEETTAYNLGFDIGLFDNRIDISTDIYQSTTKNLLMLRRLPQIIGYTDVMSNLGELRNKGFELTVSTVNTIRPNFTWNSNFVFSLNRNEIIRLFGDIGEYTVEGVTRTGELPDYTNKWFPGQSVNAVWDYELTGVWQLDQVDEAARYNQNPGDWIATDINDDGVYTEEDDKQFIGHRDPQYLLGLRNEFGFLKNFSVSLFVRADLGHIGAVGFHKHPGAYERTNYLAVNYWTPENPTNSYSSLNPFTGLYSGGYNVYFSRSFVRIQDFTLSYNVPQGVSNRAGLERLRIYSNIRNLYSFDKWDDFDPESGNTPMPRIFTMGVDLSF